MNDIGVIHLGNGGITLVDSDKFKELSSVPWTRSPEGYVVRSVRLGPHKHKNYRMHRVVIDAPLGTDVDHKSGHRWVNTEWNLRLASHQGNSANSKKQSGRSSIFKGVTWASEKRKWRAQIRVNYKMIYLGYYTSEREDAAAYNGAAIAHFGEFALLNEI